MFAFILRRAALIVPTFIGVTLLAFALIHLIPGDPVENLSGERGMDPARRERLLHEFGLDRPLPLQYAEYIGQIVKGDLGTSLTTHEPVLQEFLTLFPATIELAFFAMLFAVGIGLPAGIIAELKRNSVADDARLHADRHAEVRRHRRVPVGVLAPDPAVDRAGDNSAGGHRADDALIDARGLARGLCTHRPRQGPAVLAGRAGARAEKCAHPRDHGDRFAGRAAALRCHTDRDDLLLARRRQL